MVQVVDSGDASYTVFGGGEEAADTLEGLILIPPPSVVDGDAKDGQIDVHRGQVYRHYKGAFYTVLRVAESISTKGRLVVYRHTFTKHGDTVYVRSLEEFIGVVEPTDSIAFAPIRRFTLVFDPDDEEGTMERLANLLDRGFIGRDTSVTLVT